MKVKVSDYIAQFLVDYGITHAFTVTGGGAMGDQVHAGLTFLLMYREEQ